MMLEYQNIKIFLQKFMFLIDLKNFFAIKILCCGHMLLMILMQKTFLRKGIAKNKSKIIYI